MASKQRHGEVQIITREGEVKIKLEIDININGGELTVRALAADQGGGPKLEENKDNIWSIPDFENTKINFGKSLGG